MSTQIVSALAAVGLVGAGAAGSAQTRAFDALPTSVMMMGAGQAAAGYCRVDVVRSGTSGTADVTRQVYSNGGCVCTVVTGPSPSNGAAEEVVSALLRDRSCDSAPVTEARNVGQQVSAAATSGGGNAVVLPVLIGAVGAAGLAIALSNSSNG